MAPGHDGLRPAFHWQTWLGSALVIILFGILQSQQNYGERAWHGFIGPFDFYTYLVQHNSALPLILPLVATVPAVVAMSGELSNRYLSYTRVRAPIRVTLVRRLLRAATLTFVTFVVVALIPQFFVALGSTRYDPAGYGLDSQAQIDAAQLGWKTFSQLLVYGSWAPVLAFAGWLGVNAALYAVIAFCTVVLIPNRVIGLSLPWVVYLLTCFLMAVLWLERYSPAVAMPFNLTQLGADALARPLLGVAVVAGALTTAMLVRAPSLPQLL